MDHPGAKALLISRDATREKRSKALDNNFGDQFIGDITKIDRSKLSYFLMVTHFRN